MFVEFSIELSLAQFQKHLEDDCTQYEMGCPMSKLIGCDYKVDHLTFVLASCVLHV